MLNLRASEWCGMAESSETLGSIRFGGFDLSVETGELRKEGVRLKLSGQAIEVLVLLVASPGKLVAREELQQKLWSGASYGDPEHGLNAAVNRLRETLGDSATEPKYIETVPGRGYRFIARLDPVVPPEPEPPELEPTPESPKPRWWKRKAAIAVAACVGVAGLLYPRIAPQIERSWRLYQLQHLTMVPLTALPGNVGSPTFSPDGSQVAFGWDGGSNGKGYDLYVKVIGSDKPLRLTYHPADWLSAAWSPDGRSIAISRVAGEDSGIYLIPPTGGPERKLAARRLGIYVGTNYGKEISWSPDGKFLAYIGLSAKDALQPFLLSLDTLERTQIQTNCPQVEIPTFSPGGTFLAWNCQDTEFRSSLMLLRLKDGRQIHLLSRPDKILGLAWSSDEHRIVFSSQSNYGALWETSLARPDDLEILPIGHDASDLAAEPSGQGLAYVQGSRNVNIWRLDLLASPPQARKLGASSREQSSPGISPDGSKIAFESTQSGAREIWVADADGSNAQQVTDFRNPVTGTPRWSPDGKLIAFDSRVGGEANLYVVDPAGGVPHKLSIDRRGNCMPSWSKDGAWIYFTDRRGSGLWKVPTNGGHALQIAESPASFAMESPDGGYVYFARGKKLWRAKTDGSTEEPVTGMPEVNPIGDEWFPAEAGIYFLAHANGETTINLFDLQSRQTRPIFTLQKTTPDWIGGMPVSKDGKFMLYPQVDSASSDLMMIGNWR
jgi:Tol biopolymer transport system component/DNA-binding winged helix-turn-helix (wHTH) protein